MPETVVVAMSGGVDSSTAAAVLKEQGYNVVGIGLRLFDAVETGARAGSCCGIRDMEDARRVAQQLSIPFYLLDFRQFFHEHVIEYFLNSYLAGRTPNPCVPCNKKIKYDVLWRFCASIGASRLATGHYARVGYDGRRKRYVLMRGVDALKDQSYFLYSLSQVQLARACFPVGEMTKQETRALAESMGLKVHAKRESQDICFAGGSGYKAWLREQAGESIKPGPILDASGTVIGEHAGLPFYTVGQRRGVGVSRTERLYVSDINPVGNTITLVPEDGLKRQSMLLDDVNYVSLPYPGQPLEIQAKIRYRGPERPALLLPLSADKAVLEWREQQDVAAPGQSVVFYDKDRVVGGGIAAKDLR